MRHKPERPRETKGVLAPEVAARIARNLVTDLAGNYRHYAGIGFELC